METWIELREPGRVPVRKGPFNRPADLKKFLIELFDYRQSALVTVVTLHDSGPEFQDGPECLEMMDGRQHRRARRHRENSAAAWRAPPRRVPMVAMTEIQIARMCGGSR